MIINKLYNSCWSSSCWSWWWCSTSCW